MDIGLSRALGRVAGLAAIAGSRNNQLSQLRALCAGGMLFDAHTLVPGAVASWKSLVGSDVLIQATGSAQPVAGLSNGHPAALYDGTAKWLKNTTSSIPQPATIVVVATCESTASNIVVLDSKSAASRIYLYENVIGMTAGSTTIGDIGTLTKVTSVPVCYTITVNGASSNFRANGVGDISGNAVVGVDGLTLGANNAGSGNWVGAIHALAVLTNCAKTDARISAIESLLMQRYGVVPTQVVWEGDSRTAGQTWVNTAFSASGQGFGKLTNIATAGNTVADMVTQVPTQIPVLRGGKNIAVLWGGVNDNTLGVGAETIYNRIVAWHTAVRALGFHTVACTEIDAQDAGRNANGWHDTVYPVLNTMLRNDHSFADALVDFGAIAHAQDATNTTFFSADKVHPTSALNTELATAEGAVLATF